MRINFNLIRIIKFNFFCIKVLLKIIKEIKKINYIFNQHHLCQIIQLCNVRLDKDHKKRIAVISILQIKHHSPIY
jgi:hypothetical protein